MAKKTVVLDPGHVGCDSGAVGNGMQEAAFVLPFTKSVGEHLRRCGVAVLLTRDSTKHMGMTTPADLKARADAAAGADLLVSFHLNSNEGIPGTGYESFIQVGPYRGKPETQRIRMAIHKRMAAVATKHGLRDRGYKEADLAVLRESAPPACLVEIAFINNPTDAAKLKDAKFVSEMAAAAAQGICDALGVQFVEERSTEKKGDLSPAAVDAEVKAIHSMLHIASEGTVDAYNYALNAARKSAGIPVSAARKAPTKESADSAIVTFQAHYRATEDKDIRAVCSFAADALRGLHGIPKQ